MQTAAKQHRIHIGFVWTSAESDGRGKNHYTILTPDGESCLDYTKIHPFSYCQEDRFFQKGTQLAHATISGIPVSVLICYDLRFPEVFRIAARSAALIFVPANWLSRRSRHWQILLQARAIENQVYLLGVNCVGTQGDLQFVGGSQLVDPEGTVLWTAALRNSWRMSLWTATSPNSGRRSRPIGTARPHCMPIYIKPCEIITDRKSGGKPIPFDSPSLFLYHVISNAIIPVLRLLK